jgi:hypothetical protein
MTLLETAISEVAVCPPTAPRLPVAPEIFGMSPWQLGVKITASALEKEGGRRRGDTMPGANCHMSGA